ncbi:MAG: DNA primase, partial [Burkholderiales bacterium]|nr:DNA primase [Burkholderiales bacterium]
MARISSSFIKELIDRADVFEVVNRRVPLKVKGPNGWACCPFHNEKTPSFSVNRDKQFYHCFGCGKSGNALSFIMEYEGLSFVDAVERLAAEYGMPVKYDGSSRPRNSDAPKLSEVMLQAQQLYQIKLQDNPKAMQYITNRGLTRKTIEKFGLGFAPDSWRTLSAAFPNIQSKYFIALGLQKEGKNGGTPFDFFRNRLMFPIKNIRGQIIAFSARTMTGEEPKYINTGDTELFQKGNEMFGLYEALRAIRAKKRAIVVEGQMDVIQMSQAGFEETCAPLGTAIRETHVQKLLKLTDEIIFSFDGDTAGRKAARHAMEHCLPNLQAQQKARSVFHPEGEDPDSYSKNNGAAAFEKFLKEAKPLSEFLISSISEGLNLSVGEDKNIFMARGIELLEKVKRLTFRAVLFEQLVKAANITETEAFAKKLGISAKAIAAQPKRFVSFNRSNQNGYFNRNSWYNQQRFDPMRIGTGSTGPREAPTETNLLRDLLRNFLFYPQLALEVGSQLEDYLTDETNEYERAIHKFLSLLYAEADDGSTMSDVVATLQRMSPKEFDNKIESIRQQIKVELSVVEEKNIYEELLQEAHGLGTSIESARLETEQIFRQLDLQRALQQKLIASRQLGVAAEEVRDQIEEQYKKLAIRCIQ